MEDRIPAKSALHDCWAPRLQRTRLLDEKLFRVRPRKLNPSIACSSLSAVENARETVPLDLKLGERGDVERM